MYNGKWRKARLHFLAANPLCEDCKAQGQITAADEVHHSVKHNGSHPLFWEATLWMALCKSCHSKRTAKGE